MTDNLPSADIVREKFAARLRAEMAAREWNQSDLAREASKHLKAGDVSRDNISNYVNQKALPGTIILGALAKALGTTPDDLLPERGAPVFRGDAVMLPSQDVRDAGEGMAFIRMNRRLPWVLVAEILAKVAAWDQAYHEADAQGAKPYYAHKS